MNTVIHLNKNLIAVLVFVAGLVFAVVNFAAAAAVSYPVAELGNCDSQKSCKNFCDIEENRTVCIDYAERAKIFKSEEAERMRDQQVFEKQLDTLGDSPGGCITPRECDAYCRVEANLKECLDFGVRFGRMGREEASKILEKSERGGPGGCKSGGECKSYCQSSEHEEECLSFAKNEGDISEEDVLLLKKARQVEKRLREGGPEKEGINKEKAEEVLQTQGGPGGCKSTEECGEYCMDMSHIKECMQFAVSNDLATPQMIEFMKRMVSMGSRGPGGCKTRQECQDYCDDEEHSDECNEFAQKQGLISSEERQLMERQREIYEKSDKNKFTGPGGCATIQACDEYCSDISRVEECIDFAMKTGKLSRSVIQKMMGQSQEAREKFMEMERERAKFKEGGGEMPGFDSGLMEKRGMPGFEGPPPGFEEGQNFGPDGGNMMGPPPGYEGFGPPEGFDKFGPPSGERGYGPPPGEERNYYQGPPPEGGGDQPPQSQGIFNLLFGTILAPILLIFVQ